MATTGIYLHDGLLERKRALEKLFADKARSNMKKLCDGSRRPVRGQRHQLKQTSSRHAQATCPVCRQPLRVVSVMGVLEFPRHEAKGKGGEPAATTDHYR
jgi:hypothetical protein